MALFYISFAMPKAEGGFRGATIVEAPNAMTVIPVTWLRGLNPGGEAAILEVTEEARGHPNFEKFFNRLVGREEIFALGADRFDDLPKKQRDKVERLSLRVCSCCNPPRMH